MKESTRIESADLTGAIGASRLRLMRTRLRDERGITLIEMLVVVTIIGLFAALVGPKLFATLDRGRQTSSRVQIENFKTVLLQYNHDTGTFPSTEMGLQALRLKPDSVDRWAGPYLDSDVPMDGWGRPYLYKFPGEHGSEPDILSLGADGQPGGEGINADISSWHK